jgi:hypothetical protein
MTLLVVHYKNKKALHDSTFLLRYILDLILTTLPCATSSIVDHF